MLDATPDTNVGKTRLIEFFKTNDLANLANFVTVVFFIPKVFRLINAFLTKPFLKLHSDAGSDVGGEAGK